MLAADKGPNIIFILTDDQKYDAMGFMGHYPFLKTPNIDRIRNEGVHFKNSFVTLSMCAPARAEFLTGTYPQVNGVCTNVEGREFNQNKTPSFPLLLQRAGYETGFFGKWHLDHSNKPRLGFDRWVSFSGQGKYNGNDLNIDGKLVHNPGYITDELTDYALDFIDKNSDKPFCVYLSHKAVHQPFTPAKRHSSLYKGETVPKKESFFDNLKDKNNVKFICYEQLCNSKEVWLNILQALDIKGTYYFAFKESIESIIKELADKDNNYTNRNQFINYDT